MDLLSGGRGYTPPGSITPQEEYQVIEDETSVKVKGKGELR